MEDATNICQEADHSFINEIKDANFPKFSEKCDLSSSKSASNELESRHISDVAHFEFVFLEGKVGIKIKHLKFRLTQEVINLH